MFRRRILRLGSAFLLKHWFVVGHGGRSCGMMSPAMTRRRRRGHSWSWWSSPIFNTSCFPLLLACQCHHIGMVVVVRVAHCCAGGRLRLRWRRARGVHKACWCGKHPLRHPWLSEEVDAAALGYVLSRGSVETLRRWINLWICMLSIIYIISGEMQASTCQPVCDACDGWQTGSWRGGQSQPCVDGGERQILRPQAQASSDSRMMEVTVFKCHGHVAILW